MSYVAIAKQYDAWWKRIDNSAPATVPAPAPTVTPPPPVPSVSPKSRTVDPVNESEAEGSDVRSAAEGEDDALSQSRKEGSAVMEAKPSATTLLMQLASDMDKKQQAKSASKKPEIPNCFLDCIEKPQYGLDESNKSKYAKAVEYERKVLNHFFVFDNSA